MKLWNIHFFKNRKIYFTISIILIAVMLVGTFVLGVNLDIQFKGGAIITYSYTGEVDKAEFQKTVEGLLGQSVSLQETVDIATSSKSFVVSTPTSTGITVDKQSELADALTVKFPENSITVTSSSVVNPTIGNEFLAKSLVAVLFASILMVAYIGVRFKKIGGLTAGVTAVIALIHDLIMVFAAFVLFKMSIDANFIAVCLAILGYSLNDTIVIYDRVRENKRIYGSEMELDKLVDLSLNQSFTRSLMTSITTISAMIVVSAVAVMYNVSSILSFSLPMIVGMASGFYSSTCIAPVLWVLWQNKKASKA